MAYAGGIGFDQILERNVRSADDMPSDLVYAGFSLGEMSAQKLAQTRPGARGALLFYSCIPITGDWAFGPWPDGVPRADLMTTAVLAAASYFWSKEHRHSLRTQTVDALAATWFPSPQALDDFAAMHTGRGSERWRIVIGDFIDFWP